MKNHTYLEKKWAESDQFVLKKHLRFIISFRDKLDQSFPKAEM
jgi:hypothetical protein